MSYELDILDEIITGIHPSGFKGRQINAEKFSYYLSFVQKETRRVKKAFLTEVFSIKKEKYVELYIQHHQQELIRLTDHLLSYLPTEEIDSIHTPSKTKDLTTLYKNIYILLEDLLNHIEKHFSKYFNTDAKVPDRYRIMAIRDIKEKTAGIAENFQNKNIDPKLLKLIIHPLKRFTRDKHPDEVTFRYLIYLKAHMKELLDLLTIGLQGPGFDQKVLQTLIYLNYNSLTFSGYYAGYIKESYQQLETLSEQLEHLARWQKDISQAQVKPGFAYQPENGSLKYDLLEWLDVEICFLEKRQQLSFAGPLPKSNGLSKNVKLNTNLSVSQLAYLIKIFMENGVIQNRNQREVLKLISDIARTKKAENISPESLRSKFYSIEDSTRNAVQELLTNMIHKTRSN